jgi:hypothetical protein
MRQPSRILPSMSSGSIPAASTTLGLQAVDSAWWPFHVWGLSGLEWASFVGEFVGRSVSPHAIPMRHTGPMNQTKPSEKKAPVTGGKRKPKPAWMRLPRFPESYVHARGIGSTWRSSERNA